MMGTGTETVQAEESGRQESPKCLWDQERSREQMPGAQVMYDWCWAAGGGMASQKYFLWDLDSFDPGQKTEEWCRGTLLLRKGKL